MTFSSLETIQAGGSSPFDVIAILYSGNVDHYELLVQGN
jgi:hypothetical protein